MSFFLYILFLFLSYVRVLEAFAPELVIYKPVLVIGLIALTVSLSRFVYLQEMAARARHILILAGLTVAICVSLVSNGWLGGIPPALVDFGTPATLFILTVLNVVSETRLRVTLILIVVCTSILCLSSVAAFHTGFMADRLILDQSHTENGDDEDEPVEPTSPALLRVRSLGVLNDPNDFAQVIVMALPFLRLLWRPRANLWNLFAVATPAALFVYTIYLTHSRGGLLGMGVALAALVVKKTGWVPAALLIALLLAGAIAVDFSGGRAYSASEESAGGRIEIWGEGLSMLMSHPLFGVGYGRFTEFSTLTAHNSFVLCLAEIGLFGYFFWIGLIVLVVLELLRASQVEGSEMTLYADLTLASLAGYLLCAFFLSRTFNPFLFLLLGLASAVAAQTRAETGSSETVLKLSAWIPRSATAVALSVLLIYAIIRLKHLAPS